MWWTFFLLMQSSSMPCPGCAGPFSLGWLSLPLVWLLFFFRSVGRRWLPASGGIAHLRFKGGDAALCHTEGSSPGIIDCRKADLRLSRPPGKTAQNAEIRTMNGKTVRLDAFPIHYTANCFWHKRRSHYDTCGRASEEGFLLRQMPITITVPSATFTCMYMERFFSGIFVTIFPVSEIRVITELVVFWASCLSITACFFFLYISTLSGGRTAHFFSSPGIKKWTHLSISFGQ